MIENFDKANDYGLLEQPFPVEIIEDRTARKISNSYQMPKPSPPKRRTRRKVVRFTLKPKTKRSFTPPTRELKKLIGAFARNVDLLVMECSFVKNKPVEKHLELADAMFLTRLSEPKKVVLTHLYPEWDEVDFEKEIAKFSPDCEVIEAKDGLILHL